MNIQNDTIAYDCMGITDNRGDILLLNRKLQCKSQHFFWFRPCILRL